MDAETILIIFSKALCGVGAVLGFIWLIVGLPALFGREKKWKDLKQGIDDKKTTEKVYDGDRFFDYHQ
jgi:hypothetical protein